MKLRTAIFISSIIIGLLTIANAKDKKGPAKQAIIEKIKDAVESGEITREQAAQELRVLKNAVVLPMNSVENSRLQSRREK